MIFTFGKSNKTNLTTSLLNKNSAEYWINLIRYFALLLKMN